MRCVDRFPAKNEYRVLKKGGEVDNQNLEGQD